MSATVQPLGEQDASALRAFLQKDVRQHLYLLGLLEEFGLEASPRHPPHVFWGRFDAGALTAVLFVGGNGGLVVPSASAPDLFAPLTEHLWETVRMKACLGERSAVDALVRLLGRGPPRVSLQQRLFTVSPDDMGPFTNPRLRLAREEDLPRLVPLAAGDVAERMGHRPLEEDPEGFAARVRRRVVAGRTYVLEEHGELVFKVDVGCRSQWGAELEGIHTHPAHRRRGHATLSLGQISRHLLSSLPRLALRVDAQDERMATLVRRVGYVTGPLQRLVLME
jgi:uncharacterized protein